MDLHDYAVDATGGSYPYTHAGREVKTGSVQGPREYDVRLTITDETIALAIPGGRGGGGEEQEREGGERDKERERERERGGGRERMRIENK